MNDLADQFDRFGRNDGGQMEMAAPPGQHRSGKKYVKVDEAHTNTVYRRQKSSETPKKQQRLQKSKRDTAQHPAEPGERYREPPGRQQHRRMVKDESKERILPVPTYSPEPNVRSQT